MNPFLLRESRDPSPMQFPSPVMEEKRTAHFIKPACPSRGINSTEFEAYIVLIEQILKQLLPKDVVDILSSEKDPQVIEQAAFSLYEKFPLITWNNPDHAPCTLCASLLCFSNFTHGVGRFFCDNLSRWLIPGKFLSIDSVRALNFHFISYPKDNLFFDQVFLYIDNDHDLSIIKNNKNHVENETRLSILAVSHARRVVSNTKLSSAQKQTMIQENIASIINRPMKNLDNNVFDQMHHLFLRLNVEDKIKHIQKQILPYFEQKPKIFDRDIFQEIKRSIFLFGDQFTAIRTLKHVSRLISYQYLFCKTLLRKVAEFPEERHLSLKLIPTHLTSSNQERPVIGILGAINLLGENERFEEQHVLEAITHCEPFAQLIEHSFILERRTPDPIRIFYLEIEKRGDAPFDGNEIQNLKKNLPHALKQSIEMVQHPILMPRNEEEIMRNILLLSQQLKYLNDLPQVIISFDTQTEEALHFTVILLRILRSEDLSIPQIFAITTSELKLEEWEAKKVALLRKKYPKEANVFKISLNKKRFLRKDFTIDLLKARQEVSYQLNKIFNGIRDFNGGILSKQQETLQELRNLVNHPTSHQDFLLENFFYSLSPPLRQTLIMPASLKTLFNFMEEAMDADYKMEPFFLKAQFEPHQLLAMAASPYPGFKEELFSAIQRLKIQNNELSYTHVNSHGIHCMGYILQTQDQHLRNLFYSNILTSLQEWQSQIKK